MIKINAGSINDLISLRDSGAPVTLTSHPGNASLYKLSLWKCGIPEHLWDVTCAKADANNWPMFRLIGGNAEPLLSNELQIKIINETGPERRFVTAYQVAKDGQRLGRVHVKVCQQLFPTVISSCSKLLLSEESLVREMFYYLAETRPQEIFRRQISPDGVMTPFFGKWSATNAVDSFINVLRELEHLIFDDEPLQTRGGLCYDGVIVQLSKMLVQYWKTDRVDSYDISGPDMINYSMQTSYQREMTNLLVHLRRWNTKYVPKCFAVRMFPGTTARVGHLKNHPSEEVMARKRQVLERQSQMSNEYRKLLSEQAKDDEQIWPIRIKPSIDHYFSQHDLFTSKLDFEVEDFWRDIPIEMMHDSLTRANAILRLDRIKK